MLTASAIELATLVTGITGTIIASVPGIIAFVSKARLATGNSGCIAADLSNNAITLAAWISSASLYKQVRRLCVVEDI
jgi:hypothetical protein